MQTQYVISYTAQDIPFLSRGRLLEESLFSHPLQQADMADLSELCCLGAHGVPTTQLPLKTSGYLAESLQPETNKLAQISQ